MKTIDNSKKFIDVEDVLEVIKEGKADNIEELKEVMETVGEYAETFIRDAYFGEYTYDLFNETEDIGERLRGYVDYERIERDYRMNFIEVEIGGVVYLTLS